MTTFLLAYCLLGVGEDSVPVLIQRLKDADPGVRKTAAYALGRLGAMGERHSAALPVLAGGLKDSDKEARVMMAYAICNIALPSADAKGGHKDLVRALIGALKDGEDKV